MRTLLKYFVSVLVLALAALSYMGSGSTTKALTVDPISLDWSPDDASGNHKTDIVLALLAPEYAQSLREGLTDPPFEDYQIFSEYQKSIEGDLMELLTARGYSIRGPYTSQDEMLYADKKNAHILLMIEISPEISATGGDYYFHKTACQERGGYSYSGKIRLDGKINLNAFEPMSMERLWTKSISIPSGTTEEVKSVKVVCGRKDVKPLLYSDGAVANPVGDLFESTYQEILSKMWNHLDPQEFERLMPDIERLKEKG